MSLLTQIFGRHDRGAGVRTLEVLLMAPAAIMLFVAGVVWGDYFWLAHRAERGAASALQAVGAAPAETDLRQLAVETASRTAGAPVTHVDLTRLDGRLRLRVGYDLLQAPYYGAIWRIAPLAPPTVVGSALSN